MKMCWYNQDGEEKFVPLTQGSVVQHFKREGYTVLGNTGGAFSRTIMTRPVLKGISRVEVGEVTQ